MPESVSPTIEDLTLSGGGQNGNESPEITAPEVPERAEAAGDVAAAARPQPGGLATATKEEQEGEGQEGEEKIDLDSLRLEERLKELDKAKETAKPEAVRPTAPEGQRQYREFDPRAVEVYKSVVQHPAVDIQYINDLAQEDVAHAIMFGISSAVAAIENDLTAKASGQVMNDFQDQQIVTNAYNLLLNDFPEIADAATKHGRHVNAMIDSVSNDMAQQIGFKTAQEYVLAAYDAGKLENIQKFARIVGQSVKAILNLTGSAVEAPGAISGRIQQKTAQGAPKRGPRGTAERNSRRSPATPGSPHSEADKLKWGTFDEFAE